MDKRMALTETQWSTLRAAMDRIIPPDDFPGAWEAGVGDYLTGQFQGDLQPLIPLYQDGLDALEAEANTQYSADFPRLPIEQQDALLQEISTGKVQTDWTIEPQRFFNALVHHVHEGFYADPGNGGNRKAIAWKMIGFDGEK